MWYTGDSVATLVLLVWLCTTSCPLGIDLRYFCLTALLARFFMAPSNVLRT